MTRVVTSGAWPLHTGDWVVAEAHGEFYRIIARTPSDIEIQSILKELDGRNVVVFKVNGILP